MDVLNDILDTLDLKGALYFRTDFSPPWAVTVPDLEEAARFHLVVHGRCNVRIGDAPPVDLYPGDLILIPHGRSHILADTPEREPQRLESVIADTGYDGTGVFAVGQGDATASTQMICGHFTFRQGADHPMLRALPDKLRITSADRAGNPWLDETLRLVARRMFSDEIGAPAAVTRLSEIVFIELLRVGIDQCADLRAIVGALQDSQIGRALEIVHAEPAKPWSVESLGAAVGMSRSRFAERFSARRHGADGLSVRLAAAKGALAAGNQQGQCPGNSRCCRIPVAGRVQPRLHRKIRRLANWISP